jgi:hypothetical protein
MPLDVLEADVAALARTGADGSAPPCIDAQVLKFELIVKALQRDDPLRRRYLQKRWHSQAVGHCDFEFPSLSAIALRRR